MVFFINEGLETNIMLYLIAGLVLLIAVVTVVAVIQKKRGGDPTEILEDQPIQCCGTHEVCEADSLLNSNTNVVYYDDEELDQFAGRPGNSYNDDEIEEFQDILLTMKEAEVAAWLRSLMLRNIELPYVVKEEALMIVEEVRQIRQGN